MVEQKTVTKVVRNNEGTPLWLAHSLYETKLRAGDTAGAMALVTVEAPPQTVVAPPHRHHEADEVIFMLEGHLLVHTNEESEEQHFPLFQGDFIYMPKGTREWFETGAEPAKMLFIFTPSGGADDFFDEAAEPAQWRGLPPAHYQTPAKVILSDLSEKHHFQSVL